MVRLQYAKQDAYRTYGISHFQKVYGIPLDISDNDSGISVEVAVNDLQNQVVSWQDTDYGKIPLFEDIKGKSLVEDLGNKLRINFDVFNSVGHILSGHTETLPEADKKEIAKKPFVDIYERILYDNIKESNKKSNVLIDHKPFWPDNKTFAVCLTHDVDEVKKTYQYLTRPAMHAKRGELGRAATHIKSLIEDKTTGNNPYWTFQQLMDLEDDLGVRSSLYFLQEDAEFKLSDKKTWRHKGRRYDINDPKIVETMKNLHSGGWEVGLHGSYHSFNDRQKLNKEKQTLESVLGSDVIGTRQHNLNLKIPDTWNHQENAGLQYDTTLGSNFYLGFRWGTCFPFNPMDNRTQKTINVLQIPMAIEDIPAFRQKDLWDQCVNLIDHVERVGGVLTLLWHHSVFNDREYPGWTEMYTRIIKHCQDRNAWVTSGARINNHWRSR